MKYLLGIADDRDMGTLSDVGRSTFTDAFGHLIRPEIIGQVLGRRIQSGGSWGGAPMRAITNLGCGSRRLEFAMPTRMH